MNRVEDLAAIIIPPESPLDPSRAFIDQNRIILQVDFPDDFMQFAEVFGSGRFKSSYSWEVWSPGRPTYPAIVMEFSRMFNLYKDSMGVDDVPFGIFPEVGGILPFSCTPDGDWICWITDGEPNSWRVVDLNSYENGAYQILDMCFSEYFYRVLSRDEVLARHQGGDEWDVHDVVFRQRVTKDKGYPQLGAVQRT